MMSDLHIILLLLIEYRLLIISYAFHFVVRVFYGLRVRPSTAHHRPWLH